MMAMRINGATWLYAIVGNPILQVQSRKVCSELFAAGGMNVVMVSMNVLPEHFATAQSAALMSFFGRG